MISGVNTDITLLILLTNGNHQTGLFELYGKKTNSIHITHMECIECLRQKGLEVYCKNINKLQSTRVEMHDSLINK